MPLQLLKPSGEECANVSSQRWGTRPFRGLRHVHISLFSAEYTVSTTGVSRVKESPMGWEKVWFSCKYLEVTQSTLEERLDLEINLLPHGCEVLRSQAAEYDPPRSTGPR